ncbi:hypothetical protein BTO06_12030 [Tenacibaculum sp. SZ-18]|nr:hypothetical protein BTO06_12030 [Tenacibaculum sp. SZ-18]
MIFNCKENNSKKPSEVRIDYNLFPENWQKLTKVNGEFVIYYPCSRNEGNIELMSISNGYKILKIGLQEYHEDFLVKEIIKYGDNYILKATSRKNDDPIIFSIEKNPNIEKTYYWKWKYFGIEYNNHYTRYDNLTRFKTIHQPCSECPDSPCIDNIDPIDGKYEFKLPYVLSLDGNDYREMSLTIEKDSTFNFKVQYYSDSNIEKDQTFNYKGKSTIDKDTVLIRFNKFNQELIRYFNPKNEPNLLLINDSTYRFSKNIRGLVLDEVFCENWDIKKYTNKEE